MVTLGSKGCLVSQSGTQYVVAAYEVNAIDTTGAGDSFIGGVLYRQGTLNRNSNPICWGDFAYLCWTIQARLNSWSIRLSSAFCDTQRFKRNT